MEGQEGSEPRRRTVLIVGHSAKLSGSERSLLTIARGLEEGGVFRPLVLLPGRGPLVARLREAGVECILHPFPQWLSYRSNPAEALLFAAWTFVRLAARGWLLPRVAGGLRDRGIAVVYSNTFATDFGHHLARRLGVPHVWHVREFVASDIGAGFDLGESTARDRLGRADMVVFNSQAVARRFEGWVEPRRIRVVHNGVEVPPDPRGDEERALARWRRQAAARPRHLLLAATLHATKGHEDAIRAVAFLRRHGHDVVLDVAGSGRRPLYRRRLRRLAREHRVESGIRWHGFVDPLEPLYDEAALVVACSRLEGFGRTAAEAMARGIPVVATRVGGLREVVEDGETGFLYTPGDWEALASNVLQLLRDENLYQRMSAAGLRRARSLFSADRCVREVATAIEETLGA